MATSKPIIEQSHLNLLYNISRELTSRINLRELMERILRITTENVGAETGSLILVDEDGHVYDGALIIHGALVPDAAAQLSRQIERGLAGWVCRERQTALIRNTAADPRWAPGSANQPTVPKSALSAPLTYVDGVLGVITLVHPRPNHFTESDRSLITAIAEQAAVAVENAQLLRSSRRQAQAMRSLVETAQVLSSTLEPNKLLRLLLAEALSHLYIDAASIALMDQEKQELVYQVAAGEAAAKKVGMRIPVGKGITGWVAKTGQPVIVPNAQTDPRFSEEVDQVPGFQITAILSAPIKFEGRTLGVIEGINPLPGTLDKNTLPLLTGIASLAGNAIAHAQQYTFTQAAKVRYTNLFEDSFDPIYITDLSGKIIDVNHKAAETLGYTRSELLGLHINALHKLRTGLLGASRLRDAASGIEMVFETRIAAKDGREIPVEVRAKRISAPDYDFIQWIERDISDRVEMEEMREDLASMIFHDLRAPLGNVMSSLSLMQATLPPDDEANLSVLEIALRSSQHLSRLVDSLLDLRKLESGKAMLKREETSIDVLTMEAAQQVIPIAKGKGIEVRVDMPPQLPTVFADADMMRRVIINLIENAVKYTPGEGSVTVGARPYDDRGSTMLVSIADTGPGIPETERTRIFDKFARIQRAGAPKGLGLGLAFCRLAVEAHGGRIWVDPGLERGAVFKFTLPIKGV